ncbi:hypothetical protein [Kineothrix sp. MB12-C1]|uniref:hypothetical protein n=1 Tax=Kineothrix sp. MB12-C1 TaxID=3070215 RepID=UPI0027D2E97D|nr:hypothetical protein [Kineothrix sp. MB12-C1]WMC91234.1 hypothetical protein RBB56_10090 [Kineothrix sp. MB12-C1]
MASYKMEIKDGILSKTLTFMGMEFTEVWEERNTHCADSLEGQVLRALPDLEESEKEILEELTAMDEDELLDAIYALTVYEKSQGEIS